MPCDDFGVFLMLSDDWATMTDVPARAYRSDGGNDFSAASAMVSALMMGRPESASIFAEFLVGALHAHHQRRIAKVGRLAGGDHAGGDRVALHDAAEDVDQDGLDLLGSSA